MRALGLRPALYSNLLHNIHSTAIDLDQLSLLWTQAAIELFPDPLTFNGRRVLVGDGFKTPRQGRLMPAVKLLHQSSDSNTKAEYIMGHSHQAISLLVNAGSSVFAVPPGQSDSRRHCDIQPRRSNPVRQNDRTATNDRHTTALLFFSPMPSTPIRKSSKG